MLANKSFLLAFVTSAATVASVSAGSCNHNIKLDFNSCPDKTGAKYAAKFIATNKFINAKAYIASASGSNICLGYPDLEGYVFLSASPSNAHGTNVESVQLELHSSGASNAWIASHPDDSSHRVGSESFQKAAVPIGSASFASSPNAFVKKGDVSTKTIKGSGVVNINYC